jgi:hypothetical protein
MNAAPTAATETNVTWSRPALRARLAALRTRLDRPVVAGIIAVVAMTAEVVARVLVRLQGNVSGLALIGDVYAYRWLLPGGVEVQGYLGYDGQFYYRMARNPANLSWSAYGIGMDAWYRFVRIGYSALAWLGSAGQVPALPWALVIINVLAVGAIAVLGGRFAHEAGRHALWGLLLAGYFGLATSVARDLTEPLAAACLLGGILAYRHRQWLAAAGLFAFAGLTRETALVAPFALAIVRLVAMARRRARPGREDLVWLIPALIFVAWEVVLRLTSGVIPIFQDSGKNAGAPFVAAVMAIGHNFGHLASSVPGAPGAIIIWCLELLVLTLFAVMALCSLRATTVPVYERLALVLYVVEIFCLSPTNWDGYADLRSFVEVYLLATLILFAAPRKLWWFAATAGPLFLTVLIYRTMVL